MFTAFEWVRELNEGVNKVYEEMEAAGLPEPEFDEPNGMPVRLTLRNDVERRIPRLQAGSSARGERINEQINEQITDRQAEVLRFLSGSPRATYGAIAEAAGVSQATARRDVARLRELGLVERVGSRKSGSWRALA